MNKVWQKSGLSKVIPGPSRSQGSTYLEGIAVVRLFKDFHLVMLMTLIGLLSSKGVGFPLDDSPLKPHGHLLGPELHPECEKILLSDDGIERSTYSCRGLPVFNSFEIVSEPLEVRLSNYPSRAELLSPLLPFQDGWILHLQNIVPVKILTTPKARLFVNLQNHKVVYEEDLAFDAAMVYLTNSRKRTKTLVDSPRDSPSGFLENEFFSVISAVSPRVLISPDMIFSTETQPQFFDQVQVFIRLDQITKWFQNHRVKLKEKVAVEIHLDGPDDINNGSYIPESGAGPLIKIGQGDTFVMADLARDLDVIAHEYSHHVIYQTLKTSRGESGILHEGYADYFAFAMGGDPNLAETIMVSGQPLRSALLPVEFKYSREGKDWGKHRKSQFFSRLLWLLRETYGEGFDETVLQSLKLLKPESSLHDALHALLLASPGETERCKTMEIAQTLGFEEALKGLDGSACGFEFAALSSEKNSRRRNVMVDRKAFGCAAVSTQNSNLGSLLLLLPLLSMSRWKGNLGTRSLWTENRWKGNQKNRNPLPTKNPLHGKGQNYET